MSSNEADTNPDDLWGKVSGDSAGSLLREARLAAGVHIESIAFSLKVPVSKIEALENDDLAALPDAVFARALTSSVCRVLNADPAPVLALLPQTKVQWLPANSAGVNAAFRDGSERASSGGAFSRLSRPLGLTVVVLLIGAGVLAWVPSEWLQMNFAKSSQPITTLVSPPSLAASDGQTESPPVTTSPDVAEPTQAPVSAQQAVPESALTTAGPEDVPAQAPSPPRLQLSARGETWVQVKDGQGAVVLERILRAGDAATVNQSGLLSVVVGRADVTDVLVTGDTLNIVNLARENVARFEVNP